MTRFRVLVAAAVIAAAAPASAQPRHLVGKTFDAIVVRVADGDSIEILPQADRPRLRVRLEGVDAPELGEVFSRDAQRFLRRLVLDRRVTVSGRDVDRYGRLVARVTVAGQDASLELLKVGLACQRFATDPVLAAAESRARTAGVGFWAPTASRPQCVARSRKPDTPRRPRRQVGTRVP